MRYAKQVRTWCSGLFAGFLIAALPGALPIAAQIVRPQLGYALDSGGALRPLMGVAAAASWGDPALDHAASFACSAKLCLGKTDAGLINFAPANTLAAQPQSPPGITLAPAGPALIAVDDEAGARAWIYFTGSRQFALWQDGALSMVDYSPDGEILSLRAASGGFDYVVVRQRASGNFRREAVRAWIEHYSTSDESTTVVGPAFTGRPAATSAMLIEGGVLAASSDQLSLTRPDGQQMTFPLLGAQRFYRAGRGLVEIVAAEGVWILQTDLGRERLLMLPGLTTGLTENASPDPSSVAGAGAEIR